MPDAGADLPVSVQLAGPDEAVLLELGEQFMRSSGARPG
jgi:hypothetical protein